MIVANAARLPLFDKSVHLTVGSPPYIDARLYLEGKRNLGIARKTVAWVEWMLDVTTEALRVTNGPVIWVAAGGHRKWTYQPACEGLMWQWWLRGGECSLFRPVFWVRQGISGSGGTQWYRADVEYCMCFKRPGPLPYGEPLENGHPPKFKEGGPRSHRKANGQRVTAFGSRPSKANLRPDRNRDQTETWFSGKRSKNADGEVIANPGNLIRTKGGHLGDKLGHENEAPFPLDIPEFFIRSHCPPGGIVCDPFSGSGTTAKAAVKLSRRVVAFDLRMSQAKLTKRRTSSVQRLLVR